jgi:hypothetical protein
MKLLGAVIIAVVAIGPVSAQHSSTGGFGNVVFPGVGHASAAGNPWGNVVSPAIPQGAAAFATGGHAGAGSYYSGLIPGFRSSGGTGRGYRRGSGVYVYPAYIGGYGYGYGYGPAQPDQPPADNGGGNAPAQPPVVINQYFGSAPADQGPAQDAPPSNFHYYQAPSDTEPAPSDSTYYLIAFKDHTIYSAVAYYTEGDTLHYFTSGNVHNQASLTLVDRALTEQLNRDRNVEVRLP